MLLHADRMIERVKHRWQAFKNSDPGHRFQDRHERRRQAEHGRWTIGAVLNVVFGTAITLAGLFLVVAPGPGWIVTFLGLGLLGSEFAPTARALDWMELRLRSAVGWAKKTWDHSPKVVKILIALLGVIGMAALGYGAYRWLLAG